MTTGRERFVAQIEKAAERTDIMPQDEVKRFIRRACVHLRILHNELAAPLPPQTDRKRADRA
ncbi:hypothetical protein ASD50_22040 [Mesorhizobium sp. Root552]|jgi:hypothetical protein|nr:hypothetical protein ASD50_22040 [Mesorhizobium sp. Root552]